MEELDHVTIINVSMSGFLEIGPDVKEVRLCDTIMTSRDELSNWKQAPVGARRQAVNSTRVGIATPYLETFVQGK